MLPLPSRPSAGNPPSPPGRSRGDAKRAPPSEERVVDAPAFVIGEVQDALAVDRDLGRVGIRFGFRDDDRGGEARGAIGRLRGPDVRARVVAHGPGEVDGLAVHRERGRARRLVGPDGEFSEKLRPPSAERRTQRRPSYSVQAVYTVPSAPTTRSRLPLCQISRVMRPLPSPATEVDRLSGSRRFCRRPRAREQMSPPCEPPEKMISCQST